MNKKNKINSLNDLKDISALILSSFSERIIAINGSLGVGKTTLIKNFCSNLGVKDHVSSPTFPIINDVQTSLCLI